MPQGIFQKIAFIRFGSYEGPRNEKSHPVFFPLVVQTIETGAKERIVWLLLAHVIRACIIPENEYQYVDKQEINNNCNTIYQMYEQLFGTSNCTHSIHVVLSHLLQITASCSSNT